MLEVANHNFYIGFIQDGKFYLSGPCTADGTIHPVISEIDCDNDDYPIDRYFSRIGEDDADDDLVKALSYRNSDGENVFDVCYCPVSGLPNGSFIRKGYFLCSDVAAYLDLMNLESKTNGEWDCADMDGLFEVMIEPEVYASALKNEMLLSEVPDILLSGRRSMADFMYFAYPDANAIEYKAYQLRKEAARLDNAGHKEGRIPIVVMQRCGEPE